MALKTTARSDRASRFDKLILRRLRPGFHVLMLRRAHLLPAMPTLPDVGGVAERVIRPKPYAPLAAFWRAVHQWAFFRGHRAVDASFKVPAAIPAIPRLGS